MATFTNQATLTYNGNVITSNIATGELIEVLSATKTAVLGTYSQESEITYVINILNAGTIPYTGLTITDDLGACTFGATTLVPLTYITGALQYYVNGILQASPSVNPGPPLVISGITIPAGGVASIIYVVRANQYAPLDLASLITNTAIITSNGDLQITVSETITPESGANLTITKTISPITVTENGQITYTFTIQNTGNTPIVATDNVTVTDTFNPILIGLTANFNGVPWSTPANYSYSQISGIFATVPGQITVPAASFSQDSATGVWIVTPGVSVLTVTGTV